MDGVSKVLDTIIKAPLWFYFAAMIIFWVPMFNVPNLVETGVTSNFKLGGIPLSFFALVSSALFFSSATARSWGGISKIAAPIWQRFSFWMKLRLLPKRSRALLYEMEDGDHDWIYFEPDDPALTLVRDKGFLVAELVGDDRSWAHIRITMSYDRMLRRHRGAARRALRVQEDILGDVRAVIGRARQRATRLGGR